MITIPKKALPQLPPVAADRNFSYVLALLSDEADKHLADYVSDPACHYARIRELMWAFEVLSVTPWTPDFVRSPIFIPLKKEFFEAFERGEKTVEYRVYGKRWNETTCTMGREVVLSCGYGKQRRLRGVIVKFEKSREPLKTLAWLKCYSHRTGDAACITIKVYKSETP